MKVLLVDDHILIRKGIMLLLENEGFEFCEAQDGPEALAAISCNCYDIVLLDISLPGQNGIEVLKLIKRERPNLPVLMLTMYQEEQYAIRAMRAGASGYLEKNTPPKILVEAMKNICSGGIYLSEKLKNLMAEEVILGHKPHSHRHSELSDREFQIACQLASGKTVRKIADDINLSVSTVSTYRSRLMSKLGIKSNSELTLYMIKSGFIQ